MAPKGIKEDNSVNGSVDGLPGVVKENYFLNFNFSKRIEYINGNGEQVTGCERTML
jgi:hypothetical protein